MEALLVWRDTGEGGCERPDVEVTVSCEGEELGEDARDEGWMAFSLLARAERLKWPHLGQRYSTEGY